MKKIIAIGIISMFLLMGVSTLSVVARDAVDINEFNGNKIITDLISNFNINIQPEQTKQEAVYETNGIACTMGDWLEQSKLIPIEGHKMEFFGCSVSIDGDYAIIGADEAGAVMTGCAYVFKRDGTSWTEQAKLVAPDGYVWDSFGHSVSISGDYVIVGALGHNNKTGAAYIFKRSGTTWSQAEKLTASDGEPEDCFGGSVSISGDYALIGAPNDDNVKGSAYVFKRDGTSWTEEAKLVASFRLPLDWFGGSVSIDDDFALIGAWEYLRYGTGSAYVFKRSGTAWSNGEKLTASDGAFGDFFSASVSIDGDYALIGAIADNGAMGSAYVFKFHGTRSWTEEAKLVASDGALEDCFGFVSISGDYALIGSPGGNGLKGSAYMFKRTVTVWNEKQKLIASDGALDDWFGWSVSIDGYNALIGAREDNDATGAAYVFVKSGPDPDPDLDCGGALDWTGIKPGATVTGEFYVENIGEEGTLLNWEIESYPEWGSWTFTPDSGTDLLPETIVTVEVEVVAPDDPNTKFTGKVKVVNSDDPSDFVEIGAELKTPRSKALTNSLFLRFLQQFSNAFPILRQLLGL